MKDIRIILQARLNSSRLPGKMLLPVAGMPLVVLCAKRVERAGFSLVVATSTESADDLLCRALDDHGIAYTRGPLDDVLARFVAAAEGMGDKDLVVRLTGDNPLVDSDLVGDIVRHHRESGARYTRSLSPVDRLPYGISAEVIEAGLLRELDKSGIPLEDREHVTSWLTKRGDFSLYESPVEQDLSHLRVTVDTFDDYLRVSDIFRDAGNPLEARWQALVESLARKPESSAYRTPYRMTGLKSQSRLALGTVQLGLPYGIANKTGQPEPGEARKILKTALDYGVTLIDTAAAYGEAEKTIGVCLGAAEKQSFEIHTKLDPLTHLDERASGAAVRDAVNASIYKSCFHLGLKKLPCVLLHRWQHYRLCSGKIWKQLKTLQDQDIIGKLGVSIQTPEEGIAALEVPEIAFIQMPFNILDWRWRESGFLDKLAGRSGLHVQVRSALLQGLLIIPAEQWPVIGRQQAEQVTGTLRQIAHERERKSIQDLCYAYVRSMAWADSIVIGVETQTQLLENLDLFNAPELANIEDIAERIPKVDARLLNPAEWNK